jgi:sulfite reductase alpha subunit-like flavoprotein
MVVFVISTTGNGEFPTSSVGFWRFLLRSNLPSDILCDLAFTTFGLGDSSYAKYCWPSRKLNKRLLGLGAAELMQCGEADDQHYLGIEGSLRPWLDTLWTTLEEILPPAKDDERVIGDEELLSPSISVEVGKVGRAAVHEVNGPAFSSKSLVPGWRWARLARMDRMTREDHWQDVRLIELESLEGKGLQ